MMDGWTNPILDFWCKSVPGMWQKPPVSASNPFGWPQQTENTSSEDSWQTGLKMAQAMSESLMGFWGNNPCAPKGACILPEQMSGLMQYGLEACLDMQKKWLDGIRDSTTSPEAGAGDDLKKGPVVWLESFQKLLSPLLKVPAIGLTRSYQEDANQVMDKYNVFSTNMSALLYELYLPMEKASKTAQEQLEEMAKAGKLSGNREQSYDIWIKVLEGCYMELLQSPRYVQLLNETLGSYSDYRLAMGQLFGHSLESLPIPSNKDFDELSKEIYLLKKKFKELSKQVELQS